MTELELIDRCIKGEPQAQHLMFKTFAPKMLGICRRYALNNDEAKDLMQDGLIKVFTNLSKFKGNSKLETWMTRIVVNNCIDQYNKNKKMEFTDLDGVEATLTDDDGEELPFENLPFSEEQLLDMIQSLPAGYRIVFNLYVLEELKHHEIAERLGISEGTSKSQYFRAKKMLKEKLEQKMVITKN